MVRTIKKYTLESFSECTGVGNVVEVGRKSVPGGWTTVGEIKSNLRQFFLHVTYGRGSVLVWWHTDMLRISGFMDDVIFAHKPRLPEVAVRLRQ